MADKYSLKIFIFVLLTLPATVSGKSPGNICEQPLSDKALLKVFKQNALNQLALEFGEGGLFIYEIESHPIDSVLVRMDAYAKYPKPGQKDLATMRIKAWVSRCQGTTIVRGNTWLVDGKLVVPRYSASELTGKGLHWGNPDAKQRYIVYLDSRCPHCHRLISYAKKLVESGKVFIDIRQVAFLEEVDEAITDTRLMQTSLIKRTGGKITDEEYLEMVGGFPNEVAIELKGGDYEKAVQLVQSNTRIAREVLHIITVPGVFVQEPLHNNQYRQMGYWELNRIFQ